MRSFDLQGIEIDVPQARAFRYIADPAKLPLWAEAFESVDHGKAVLRTPQGGSGAAYGVESHPPLTFLPRHGRPESTHSNGLLDG